MPRDPFIREKFTKERTAARKLAMEYFERFPKDKYQTEVEGWRHPQSDNIEFTIKRLPVHDSLIVPASKFHVAKGALADHFRMDASSCVQHVGLHKHHRAHPLWSDKRK